MKKFSRLTFGRGCFIIIDMKYIELTVHTTSEASEAVADAMWEATPHGVTVCDSRDIVALQRESAVFWDYIDESVQANTEADVLVKCYFEPQGAEQKISELMKELALRKRLSGGLPNFGTLEETKREIEGDDWIDVWKKHFRPIRLGKIVVVPEWISYQKQAQEEIVFLDSNMAFGTGEHETTSMCIELLQEYLQRGDVCIDVGCGSGILGISAAKLGAKACYLCDLDPVAVESAKHNALKNGVAEITQIHEGNLLDGLNGAHIEGDVVLANITAEILIVLASTVRGYMKRGGVLILSGIIAERLAAVKKAYEEIGLSVLKERQKGEWFALVLGGAA